MYACAVNLNTTTTYMYIYICCVYGIETTTVPL